jgi:hypothetical protein
MALPATKVSAPASATRRMLSTLMPPSTSRRMSRAAGVDRVARVLDLAQRRVDEALAAKAGLTLMIRMRSMSSITQSSTSSGWAGLNTSPACTPLALIGLHAAVHMARWRRGGS